MDSYRNKNGHIVITCSREQVVSVFGGYGICDSCNETNKDGFLIPVLGRKWYCPKCKDEWEKTAKAYPEDAEYELFIAKQMLKSL